DWPLERALEIGDKATGGSTLTELYEQMRNSPTMVDLPDLWRQLGVSRRDGGATFDDSAPLASTRKTILSLAAYFRRISAGPRCESSLSTRIVHCTGMFRGG